MQSVKLETMYLNKWDETRFERVCLSLLSVLITPALHPKSKLNLLHFPSELSTSFIESRSRAKENKAINAVPLRCPWFPASSAAFQPSGRSHQSHYPNENGKKNKRKITGRLNWMHLENHFCSLKCKTWGRGRQELRLAESVRVCWATYFPQTWVKMCPLLFWLLASFFFFFALAPLTFLFY